MIKYIAYCRKSTDEKEKQVLSIESQIAELKEFATKEKLHVVCFLTESRTAKSLGRPVFEEVIQKIEKGEANAILSWHPDRLARNSVDGGKIIYLLDTGKLLDLKFLTFWFDNIGNLSPVTPYIWHIFPFSFFLQITKLSAFVKKHKYGSASISLF